MKLGFVGGGIMAEALITGIKDAGLDAEITVGEPVAARRDALAEVGISAVADNIEAISGTDIVALAIKPQQLDPVAESLKGKIDADREDTEEETTQDQFAMRPSQGPQAERELHHVG